MSRSTQTDASSARVFRSSAPAAAPEPRGAARALLTLLGTPALASESSSGISLSSAQSDRRRSICHRVVLQAANASSSTARLGSRGLCSTLRVNMRMTNASRSGAFRAPPRRLHEGRVRSIENFDQLSHRTSFHQHSQSTSPSAKIRAPVQCARSACSGDCIYTCPDHDRGRFLAQGERRARCAKVTASLGRPPSAGFRTDIA